MSLNLVLYSFSVRLISIGLYHGKGLKDTHSTLDIKRIIGDTALESATGLRITLKNGGLFAVSAVGCRALTVHS